MDGRKDDDASLSRIPVFIFPSAVIFNANDREHLKQIITIYNPYEFPVRFKVLSTTPAHYTVVDPEGSISPKNSVDLIVRLTAAVPTESSSPFIEDKLRVQIYNYIHRQQIGRKDVPSLIHFGNLNTSLLPPAYAQASGFNSLESASSPEAFQQCPSSGIISSPSMKFDHSGNLEGAGMFYSSAAVGSQHYNPNYVAVLTALVCIVGLMLPTNDNEKEGTEPTTLFPSYLHLTINQKLLIAYTLGLVTMVIFRPQ